MGHLHTLLRAMPDSLDQPLGRLPLPVLLLAHPRLVARAAEAGIDTLGMADCNDPALFVAEAEGKPVVTVPLDDNVRPHLYDPLSAYVTAWH